MCSGNLRAVFEHGFEPHPGIDMCRTRRKGLTPNYPRKTREYIQNDGESAPEIRVKHPGKSRQSADPAREIPRPISTRSFSRDTIFITTTLQIRYESLDVS
jgi:hypothetical protein